MDYPVEASDSIPNSTASREVKIIFSLISDRTKKLVTFLNCVMFIMMFSSYWTIIARHPQRSLDLLVLSTILIPLLLIAGLQWFICRRKEAMVCLSAGGLDFTGVSALALLNRAKRDWFDLHSIQITFTEMMGRNFYPQFRGQPLTLWQSLRAPRTGPYLTFDFKSGGSAAIDLSHLTRSQAEELFSAIEKYGEPSKFSSDFVKMQKAIVLERLDMRSFTQLWSESLSPRYCSTNYVPLPTNHELQNGRYSILMELAAGGMSAVYLAKTDGSKVILKESVVPPDTSEQQREKARILFEREATLLLKLKHPQIAKVMDRFVESSRDYLVLEYLPGLTLGQLVKAKGKQKEKDVRNWCRQLVEILIYLHGQEPPLLHRDLTPDNIILKDDNSVFLIDFGAANEFVGQATGTMIGKQCYIAPEQLRGKATQLSDLYALGGTLYYLLTGDDPEPLSVSRPSHKCPQVSQAFSDLVARLTAFEVLDRPSSAVEVLKLLDGLGTSISITKG